MKTDNGGGRRGMAPSVAVLGGGVGGMSAAHELVERGFRVTVYEAKSVQGGKARSIFVPGTGSEGRRGLPGEHGFRFFPSFYKHLPDTMKRIPFGTNPQGVFDNLVATDRTRVFQTSGAWFDLVSHFPRSLEDFRKFQPSSWYSRMGIPDADTKEFLRRTMLFLTSCPERRLAESENVTYWDYYDFEHRHPNFQRFFGEIAVQSLVAMRPRLASARTTVTIGLQLLLDHLKPGTQVARVLNGPTHDAWLDPWLLYLRQRGVDYRFGTPVAALDCEKGRIIGARLRSGEIVRADYYVSALPAERMAPLVDEGLAAADPQLAHLSSLSGGWMTGLQFFLRRDLRLAPGHLIFADSPWALTGISQPQFWAPGVTRTFGDGSAAGVLSVCISDWTQPGVFVRKPARECTREEIVREVWAQLQKHIASSGQDRLDDQDLVDWYLSDSVEHRPDGTVVNHEPLLVNTAGSWWRRPEACTRIENLFLASDYVRTHTDIATMESANEAARRAVNGVLERSGRSAAPCEVWPLEEPAAFAAPQALDRKCLKLGLPHPLRSLLVPTPAPAARAAEVVALPTRERRAVRATKLDADVVVVGAGPAGTSTALNLVKADRSWGSRVLVLDRAQFPRPKLCGGAVTHLGEKVLRRMGLGFVPPHVAVREVRLVYDGQACIFRGYPVLRIARRELFDAWLVREAQAAGVTIRQGEAVTAVKQHDDFVELTTSRGVLRARVVVAADGSNSTVRRLLGLRDAAHVARLLEVLTPEKAQEPAFRDGVAVFEYGRVGTSLAGYVWDFPSLIDGKPVMNRGIYDGLERTREGQPGLVEDLQAALRTSGLELDGLDLKGHPIRTFNPRGPLSMGSVLLAGDAAGVDPLLGEGISFSLAYGEVAADAIGAAFKERRFDFADYARRVRRHTLLGQLPARAHLAQFRKRLKDPRLISWLWRMTDVTLRQTRWSDQDYVPAEAYHPLLAA
ncbi:MAG TPA: FAD-dependent oxidoreductase [Myxococcaceae bacterium]|nr:FAD-dependent oxidoreductase [Myxococcaceae bacterium]